jgi:glutathione S-transferase
MSTLSFVDLATARAAPGVRMVVAGQVPSPWSEAAKGLFRIAGVPVSAVRRVRPDPELFAWTGADNVPVVLFGNEPPRTHWAAITTLAARLAGPEVLLPDDPVRRAEVMGVIHEIAGEEGIGWNGRLAMIDASLSSGGQRGFPLAVGEYLARRYGYAPDAVGRAGARLERQLGMLRDRLLAQRAAGHAFLDGPRISALDVYLATFLTPLSAIPEEECPNLDPRLRQAFATAHETFGALVPPELAAHRRTILEDHLAWPIAI